MTEELLASLSRYLPEVVVILTMMFLLYLESVYSKKETSKSYMYVSSAIGLVLALVICGDNFNLASTGAFTNAVIIDPFSTFLKLAMILGALGCVYLTWQSEDLLPNSKGEYLILTTGILAGGMLLASANNFLTLYLAIETLSILSYSLASFKRNDSKSSEAGLKYVLYGGISSGIMLFGISHIFGILGTIQFSEMGVVLKSLSENQVFILLPNLVLFFAGLGYKLSTVPFHMWTPDVYEGSPTPVTAFFATVPKIAAIGALVRFSYVLQSSPEVLVNSWLGLLVIIAALTMTVGNVAAIGQRSVKRMLAYSSISHAGVLLVGVTVLNEIGNSAILFYVLAYVFMTLVAFFVVSMVSDQYGNDHFERFSGLFKKHPFAALALSLSMFSLAGIPPFSGFVAKFNIIYAVVEKGNFALAVITALNSVISLYYYLKIVRLMALKDAEDPEPVLKLNFVNQLVVCLLAIPILVQGIFWNGFYNLAKNAAIFVGK